MLRWRSAAHTEKTRRRDAAKGLSDILNRLICVCVLPIIAGVIPTENLTCPFLIFRH